MVPSGYAEVVTKRLTEHMLFSESVSCHATCPQNVSAATALADAWRTEPDDALGDDYARHALTGEADAFRTPSPMGGDLC